jgi:hypothetical protein
MKRLFSIWILFISLQSLGQTIESAKYNMSIIDSCISKIDTTIKVVQFHFVGDRDPVFQKKLIKAIDAIESVDCLLCDVSPCGCANMKKLRGMSISIYYDSISCVLNCGSYTSDPETGETIQTVTVLDDSYCWTFKAGEDIKACEY